MAYTINPNAKNVWIRDNEDTMDLSPITDASSVYLENGRTLEQELGEGSMVSNVATVDNSMSKVIDGTLDGAYESCVFKGRTLVNLATEKNMASDYSIRFIGRQITGKVIILNAKKSDSCYFNLWSIDEQRYTKHVNVNSNALIYDIPNGQYIYNIYDTAVTSGEGNMLLFSDIMIIEYQEGMENWDIPYFEGLCDVKMPIVRNIGKNLIGGTGEYIGLAGTEGATGSNVLTGDGTLKRYSYIARCKPNTTYTLTTAGTANRCSLGEYSEYPRIGIVGTKWGNANIGGTLTITTKPTTTYLVCYSYYSAKVHSQSEMGEIVRGLVVQLEESPTTTTYEPYKTNILHTSEEIVLREVNGVQDTYNPLTGEYVRRIGEVVFDGSSDEDWSVNKNIAGGKQFVYNASLGAKGGNATVISDKLPSIVNANESYVENIWIYNGTTIVIHKNLQDANELKTWLSQNPITVQYELAEPVTTIVKPSTMTPFAYQNGHVILESGYEGQSLLPAMEYSTTINKTVQIKNIGNTILRQEKQLTTMEKMLIQNIIDIGYNNALTKIKLAIEEVK